MKLGRDLAPGDVLDGRRILRVEKRVIPACVLHSYYAERFPDGMPGASVYFVKERDRASGMTTFDDDYYEVNT